MRLLAYEEGITPPTVMLALLNPNEELENTPQVYGDNPKDEQVRIDVTEREGRYFAKFRTEKEIFPDEEYEKEVEFTPKGDDLLLYIVSRNRESEEDGAGVRITINNNTSKKFVVRVLDDDKDNPRVKIDDASKVVEYRY